MSETPIPPDRPSPTGLENESGRATVYEKVPPDVRRDLDRAIIDHNPQTYRGIYDKFRLAERGLSFWALYRYARNIRSQAEKLHLSELVLPDSSDLGDTLPKLIAQRLFQVLLYEEQPPAKEIHWLTNAYRSAVVSALAREKFAAARAAAQPTAQTSAQRAQQRDNDDFLKTAVQYLEYRAKADKAEAAGARISGARILSRTSGHHQRAEQ